MIKKQTWAFDDEAAPEQAAALSPAAQAELDRRQAYLRRIHAGQQPTKPPHRSYFRLGLLIEADGRYMLTDKAVELYINDD